MTAPLITLNNGVEMPAFGFGVYRSEPAATVDSVKFAIETGYRLIDTAAAYHNEAEVGQAIRNSGVAASDLFITTKLWLTDWNYDGALRGFDRSMRKLGLDVLDLYLLHWPLPQDFTATLGAWRALEELQAAGRVRAIGVCNFNEQNLDALRQHSDIVPVVNQVELHPFFAQTDLRAVHAARDIVTEAWSPIGGVSRYGADAGKETRDPLKAALLQELGRKYGKSPAQIILRWHVEHGIVAIPKSSNPARIAQNFNIFDFDLTAEELTKINDLDTGKRSGPDPQVSDNRDFKVLIED